MLTTFTAAIFLRRHEVFVFDTRDPQSCTLSSAPITCERAASCPRIAHKLGGMIAHSEHAVHCEKRSGGVLTYNGTLHARRPTGGTCHTQDRTRQRHRITGGCACTGRRYQTGTHWCHHRCCRRIAFAGPPPPRTEVTKGQSRVLA